MQYAHARICRVFRQLDEKGWGFRIEDGLQQLALLGNEDEQALLTELSRFPEMIEIAAASLEPHLIANWLRELANALHTFYDKHKVLIDETELRHARLALLTATRQVLKNGLGLLGLDAPESM